MPTHRVTFRSRSLVLPGEFWIHLAEKDPPPFMLDNPCYRRPARTLILLHGYSGNCEDWLYNSRAAEWSLLYNLNIVMPSGGLDFYLDRPATGKKYASFIGEDLVDYLRATFGIALTAEDTFIGGASMGGFGAIHTAFAYPDRFSRVIALSSALIIHGLKDMRPGMPDPVMANYAYYEEVFGDLQKAEQSDANPEVLFLRNRENGIQNPPVYMACGTEDFLLGENRAMRDFLENNGADFRYEEGPGVHSWSFWNPRCEEGIRWALQIDNQTNRR